MARKAVEYRVAHSSQVARETAQALEDADGDVFSVVFDGDQRWLIFFKYDQDNDAVRKAVARVSNQYHE